MVSGVTSRMLVGPPLEEAIVLGRQDRAAGVEPLRSGFRGQRHRLRAPKLFRHPAPPEAGIDSYIETRARAPSVRNLRHRGALAPWPPACLPAPFETVGAHEKNARECDSGRRVAGRAG